jgi:hypothetical protein
MDRSSTSKDHRSRRPYKLWCQASMAYAWLQGSIVTPSDWSKKQPDWCAKARGDVKIAWKSLTSSPREWIASCCEASATPDVGRASGARRSAFPARQVPRRNRAAAGMDLGPK